MSAETDYPTPGPDVLRDAFLRFLGEGLSNLEALEQMDPEQWKAAMRYEMMHGDAQHYNPVTMCFETHDGLPSLLDLQVLAKLEEGQQPCVQCLDLWGAGWTSERPNPNSALPTQSMSLYWRRPPKGKRPKGRLFLSTNQAWQALQKEKNTP